MNLFFDLDGTISDPFEGITKSINHALVKMGRNERDPEHLSRYIGPSLKVAFEELLGTDNESAILQGIAHFRERYFSVGYKENILYEGIGPLLEGFKQAGHKQYIVTSKRQDIATDVIRHFGLEQYFEGINGCDIHLSKSELVRKILKDEALDHAATVMIGDRSFDIEAGNQNNVKTVGVLWGYGNENELREAKASEIVRSVDELSKLLT